MSYPYGHRRQLASESRRQPSRGGVGVGLRMAIGYVVVMWGMHIINTFTVTDLTWFGIHPRDTATLWHVLTWSFLHANLDHLIANTATGAFLAFIVAMTGRRTFWEVTIIAALVGGLGAWLLGYPGTNHIGASGVIYGWLTYLIVRGLFNRSLSQFLVGAILAFSYSGFVWGVLPSAAAVSWQGHLGGAIGGVLAGALITSDDPIRPLAPARRSREDRMIRRDYW